MMKLFLPLVFISDEVNGEQMDCPSIYHIFFSFSSNKHRQPSSAFILHLFCINTPVNFRSAVLT